MPTKQQQSVQKYIAAIGRKMLSVIVIAKKHGSTREQAIDTL